MRLLGISWRVLAAACLFQGLLVASGCGWDEESVGSTTQATTSVTIQNNDETIGTFYTAVPSARVNGYQYGGLNFHNGQGNFEASVKATNVSGDGIINEYEMLRRNANGTWVMGAPGGDAGI